MAEAVLRAHVERAGLSPQRVRVTSAGVSSEEQGNPVDSRAARALREAGYTYGQAARMVAEHSAHRITDSELAQADVLLAMTSAHARELQRRMDALGLTQEGQERIRLYREYDNLDGATHLDPAASAGATRTRVTGTLDVPDPWYGDYADFLATLAVVENVSATLTALLKKDSDPMA